jgi:transcriptional regulator with XRE-family HTH domain
MAEYGASMRVKTVRKAFELTQAEFAERIKISRTYLASIEERKRKVNERVISLIATAFGINEQWLLTGLGDMFDKPKDHRLDRVMHNFSKLDILLQDFLLKEIDLLLEYQDNKDKG